VKVELEFTEKLLLYQLIEQCSEVDPDNRPTMKEIVEILITHQEKDEISLETTSASSLREIGLFRHTERRTLRNQQRNESLSIEMPAIALDSQQDPTSKLFSIELSNISYCHHV
jgi:hypothetical protein